MEEPNVIYLTIDADETWVVIVVDMLTKTAIILQIHEQVGRNSL